MCTNNDDDRTFEGFTDKGEKAKDNVMQFKRKGVKRKALGAITNQDLLSTRIHKNYSEDRIGVSGKHRIGHTFFSTAENTDCKNSENINPENRGCGKDQKLISQCFEIDFKIYEDELNESIPKVLDNNGPPTEASPKVEVDSDPDFLPSKPLQTLSASELADSAKIICEDDVIDCSMEVSEENAHTIHSNLFACDEYSDDVYAALRKIELKYRPKPHYMKKQYDITSNMRCILIDWMVEVGEEYKLQRETICLSVNYVDRFLSLMSVLRNKLQLVGAAAMFLAAKFEEIYPHDVDEFVYITDNTYTKEQILRMEILILKALDFNIAVPTASTFAEKFLIDSQSNSKVYSLAMYMIELSFIEVDPFITYLPSIIAASATCLARQILFHDPLPAVLVAKSGYNLGDLLPCMKDLSKMLSNAVTLAQQAIQEKYKQSCYQFVSKIPSPNLHLNDLI